jgi:ABC-2 type transport system ATP-binding protein
MSEMALVADHLIAIGRGRLLADASIDQFIDQAAKNFVRVRAPEAERLAGLLSGIGASVAAVDGALQVTGRTAAEIGDLAAENGLTLHELVEQRASLEDAFLKLTGDSVEYHGTALAAEVAAAVGGPTGAPGSAARDGGGVPA